MIWEKDMLDQYIQMEVIMKVNGFRIKEMDLENLFGQMALPILVNGNRMKLMDMENFVITSDIT